LLLRSEDSEDNEDAFVESSQAGKSRLSRERLL
jgi:hypothetical protein